MNARNIKIGYANTIYKIQDDDIKPIMAECIDSTDYNSSIDLSHLSSSSDDDDVKEYELQGLVGKKPK